MGDNFRRRRRQLEARKLYISRKEEALEDDDIVDDKVATSLISNNNINDSDQRRNSTGNSTIFDERDRSTSKNCQPLRHSDEKKTDYSKINGKISAVVATTSSSSPWLDTQKQNSKRVTTTVLDRDSPDRPIRKSYDREESPTTKTNESNDDSFSRFDSTTRSNRQTIQQQQHTIVTRNFNLFKQQLQQ